MTREEAVALLERYSNYDGMGIPNLAGCKEAMKVAVESLKEAFPELRESEDERIKKELIEFIKSLLCNDAFDRYKLVSWIAWLEKQKENPKSADSIPSDCVSDAKCEDKSPKHSDSDGTDIRDTPAYWKGWDDAMKQKEQNHPNGCFTCDEYKKGYEAGRLNGFTAGYNKAMKEVDQKEQKQEWSDEDREMIQSIITNGCVDDKQERWLRMLPERICQPKQVWSEEDREMIDHLIEALPMWANGRIAMLPSQADEYVERLKSLRPQPKVELSEDVKKTLDEVSHILVGLNYKQLAKDYKQAVEKLLYSHPHWKPSEEQLEALNALNCHGGLSYVGQQNQLISLYNDLKKLI